LSVSPKKVIEDALRERQNKQTEHINQGFCYAIQWNFHECSKRSGKLGTKLDWTGLCWTPGGGGGGAGAEAGVIIKQHRRSLLEKRVFLANLCGSAA